MLHMQLKVKVIGSHPVIISKSCYYIKKYNNYNIILVLKLT